LFQVGIVAVTSTINLHLQDLVVGASIMEIRQGECLYLICLYHRYGPWTIQRTNERSVSAE